MIAWSKAGALCAVVGLLLSGCQCGTEPGEDAGRDSGEPRDSGTTMDAGPDAGFDAGTADTDSGVDAGVDAGLDAGSDAGMPDGGVVFDAGVLVCPGATTFALAEFTESELDAHPAGCLSGGHYYFEQLSFSTDPLLVTQFATCAAGGAFGNCCFTPAMGCFYSPDAGQVCSGLDAGMPPTCMPVFDGGVFVGIECPDAGSSSPPPPVYLNAGIVTLSDDATPFATIPFSNSPYQWLAGSPFMGVTPSPFPAGSRLEVSAAGGPDVGAFDSSVVAVSTPGAFSPSTCGGIPPVVPRSQDAHFTWQPDPRGGAAAYLSFAVDGIGTPTPGGTLTCWAPDDLGELTIPAAALQLFPATPQLPAALLRVRTQLACPGGEGGNAPAGLSLTVQSTSVVTGIIDLQ